MAAMGNGPGYGDNVPDTFEATSAVGGSSGGAVS